LVRDLCPIHAAIADLLINGMLGTSLVSPDLSDESRASLAIKRDRIADIIIEINEVTTHAWERADAAHQSKAGRG
jgi:hypothetical protein